jgi:hypothetical protein
MTVRLIPNVNCASLSLRSSVGSVDVNMHDLTCVALYTVLVLQQTHAVHACSLICTALHHTTLSRTLCVLWCHVIQAFTPGDAVQSLAAPALLGEIVLATKDSNRRTREAAVRFKLVQAAEHSAYCYAQVVCL